MKTTVSVRLHNAGSHWQSLCHVCLQCIEGKHWAKMQYYRNCVLKKDIRNKPSKAPISNHIYCTLICDLQLLSTKLHCFYDSWMGHLNTILISQWDSCSVAIACVQTSPIYFRRRLHAGKCCEENMRISQEMRGDRGDEHA